jgi:hypothetical protein
VRVHGHSALAAAAGDDLVDPGPGQRAPVIQAEPQLRPVRLGVPSAGPQVAVQAASRLMTDPDGPGRAAVAADPDLPSLQVQAAAGRVAGVVADPGELRQPDAFSRGLQLVAWCCVNESVSGILRRVSQGVADVADSSCCCSTG